MKSFRQVEAILYNYKKLKAELKACQISLDAINQGYEISLPGIVLDGLPHSKAKNPDDSMFNIFLKREKSRDELKEKISHLETQIEIIENAIGILTENEKKLIEDRYIAERSWKEIFFKRQLSQTSGYRYREKIINKLRKYL